MENIIQNKNDLKYYKIKITNNYFNNNINKYFEDKINLK